LNVGFIGLGTMGLPMAANLLRAGNALVVWNRSPARCRTLAAQGAGVAASAGEVFAVTSTVLLMLLDEDAIDAVLDRKASTFATRVAGKTIVNLGTVSAKYSRILESDLVGARARYVEAPVSGSRVPAERGTLVGMVAGHRDSVAAARPVLEPLCARIFDCGHVPNAIRTKLAVNHYLIALVAALGESVQAARAAGVDLAVLRDVLDAGPMASDVSRGKLDKLIHRDFAPQASVRDAGRIARLSLAQACAAGASAPLLKCCLDLYRAAVDTGWQELDMIAATRTLERPT
jgi:3-hydroxyisobutyrate dehydrogenase